MDDDPKDPARELPARESAPDKGETRRESSFPRRRLEGVIPDLLKRAVELGVEKAFDAPESLKHLVGEMRLPKDVASYLFSQVEDTKNGALRVVAKETRDFLEHTNLAHELKKALTTLQFEINTTIRFRAADNTKKENGDESDDATLPKPEVKLDVFARRERKKKSKED